MTILRTTSSAVPGVLGGDPAFPAGLAFNRPSLPDTRPLLARLERILASGQLTNGPTVAELEERVAARLGVRHAVAVSSCTSGLMLTFQALGARGPVVMPSFTFSAGPHAVRWAGGRPRFADIAADSLCVDPERVRPLVAGARAVSATHLYGTPCRTEELDEVAGAAGIPLVYDAAHALGARRRGRPIGGFGKAEVFSLSPTKVATGGEGGLVTTDDAALAEALRIGRNYGNPGDYDCAFVGLNARMSELHAAVALHSLQALDEHIARRTVLAGLFWRTLAGVPGLRGPRVEAGDVPTHKDLTLLVDAGPFGLSAAQLGAALRHERVESRRYFHPPAHAQTAYRDLLPAPPLPVTELAARSVLSVPLWSHMAPAQVVGVADAIVRIHENADAVRTCPLMQEVA